MSQVSFDIEIKINSQLKKIETNLYLEACVSEAEKLTHFFFEKFDKRLDIFPDSTQWCFYDRFFQEIALPYTKYKNLLPQIENATEVKCLKATKDLVHFLEAYCAVKNIIFIAPRSSVSIKGLLSYLVYFLLTLSSFLYLIKVSFSKKTKIGIWTGDYLTNGLIDPRLGSLDLEIKKQGFEVIPFIRTAGVSPRNILRNYLTRRGIGIYTEPFKLFFKKGKKVRPNRNDLFEDLFTWMYQNQVQVLLKEIAYWKRVMTFLKIKVFIPWFLSSRTAPLLWAAKTLKIPTIGFMHGVSVKSYMRHELMPEYSGPPIGTDYFGVWSKWWQDYFIQYSKIYPLKQIEISGPFNKPLISSISTKLPTNDERIKVYIISEGQLPISELIPYLEVLMKNPKFLITFKIRPFGEDIFWKQLNAHKLIDTKNFNISREPTPQCFSQADVVLGTHSTALLEALSLSKPILALNTHKWGDYFGFQNQFQGNCPFWVENPEALEHRIKKIITTDFNWQGLYNQYFSEGDAKKWVTEKILHLTKV